MGVNGLWAYDFAYDDGTNDQQTTCMNVVEEYTRECLAINNSVSPHSSLINMTPEHFCRQYGINLHHRETLKN